MIYASSFGEWIEPEKWSNRISEKLMRRSEQHARMDSCEREAKRVMLSEMFVPMARCVCTLLQCIVLMMMLSSEKMKYERIRMRKWFDMFYRYLSISNRFQIKIMLFFFSLLCCRSCFSLSPICGISTYMSSHLWFSVFLFFRYSIHSIIIIFLASQFIRAYVCSLMSLPIASHKIHFVCRQIESCWRASAYCTRN